MLPLFVARMCFVPYVWRVYLADGDFWFQFIHVKHFQRAVSGMGSIDFCEKTVFYYIPFLRVGMRPFLFVIIFALLRLPWNFRPSTKEDRLVMFGFLWICFCFFFCR